MTGLDRRHGHTRAGPRQQARNQVRVRGSDERDDRKLTILDEILKLFLDLRERVVVQSAESS